MNDTRTRCAHVYPSRRRCSNTATGTGVDPELCRQHAAHAHAAYLDDMAARFAALRDVRPGGRTAADIVGANAGSVIELAEAWLQR